jgi:hypothetical protein
MDDYIDKVAVPQVMASPGLSQSADETIALKAAEAEIHGSTAKVEERGSEPNVGYWTDAHDFVQWTVNVTHPHKFAVKLTYACNPGSEGSDYEIVADDQTLSGTVAATKSWDDFVTVTVGSLNLTKTGPVKIIVRPLKKPGEAVMNLQSIALVPDDHS